LTKRLKIIS